MPDSVARIAVRVDLAGIEMVNTFHYALDASFFGSTPNMQTLATDWWAKVGPTYRTLVPTNCNVLDVTASDEENPLAPTALRHGGVHAVNVAGGRTVVNFDLPTELCAVCAWRTDVYGRGFKGRSFLPPAYTTAALSSKKFVLTQEYYVAAQAFGNKMLETISGGTAWTTSSWNARLAVYSRRYRALGAANWWADVKTFSVGTTPHFLRSRQK